MMLNYYKYLLDTLSTYTTPTGPLLDQGVAIRCNQCATGAHSFSNIPWIRREPPTVTSRRASTSSSAPASSRAAARTERVAIPSVAGVKKMLNTLLTAAGVTKTGGGPTDNFGDASLPKGIFSELVA